MSAPKKPIRAVIQIPSSYVISVKDGMMYIDMSVDEATEFAKNILAGCAAPREDQLVYISQLVEEICGCPECTANRASGSPVPATCH